MQARQRLVLFLKTLNPDSYSKLCEEMRLGDALKQFLFTFSFLFFIMLLLFIPSVFVGAPRLAEQMGSFEKFSLGGEFEASEPITILNDPLVEVDLSENATLEDETLLFTERGIEWRTWYFFGRSAKSWDELKDAKGYSEDAYTAVLIFLIPSLAFWLGLVLLLEAFALALLFTILAYLLPRIWRLRISSADAFKVTLFSSSIMLLVQAILFPFVRVVWVPILIFAAFVAVGAFLVGDRDLSDDHPVKRKRHDFE